MTNDLGYIYMYYLDILFIQGIIHGIIQLLDFMNNYYVLFGYFIYTRNYTNYALYTLTFWIKESSNK